MDNICIIENEGCSTFVQKVYETCLPIRRYCSVNVCDGLLTSDPCPKCPGEKIYQAPYHRGDLQYVQTKYYDTWSANRECPTTFGLEVAICDHLGNDVSTNIADFASDYVSGWTGEHSYQTICIDTSLAIFDNLKCWSLRFSNGVPEQDCSSLFFTEVEDCIDLIEISSTSSRDCFNNYYGVSECFGGTSNFEFKNTIRLRANLTYSGSDAELAKFGESTSTVDSRKYFILNVGHGISANMDCLLQSILTGNNIQINGQTYYIDQINRSSFNEGNRLFSNSYEVYQKCSFTQGCN